jgi:hypothetical protein
MSLLREKQICKTEENKRLKPTALCIFCFAGPHSRQGREEKEKAGQIRPFPAWSAAAREPTPRQ